MKKVLSFQIFFFCLFHFCGFSQSSVSGVVTEFNTDDPLIGVSIIDLSSGKGTTTDFDGKFQWSFEGDETQLQFSYVGYQDKVILVKNRESIQLSMDIDGVQLNQVVITGLGTKRQKRELGYSTEKIEGEVIALSNAPNVINALSGKSAGINVVNANGVDGGTTRITIRGNNNINGNNQPLIIVDGVPIENPPGLTGIGRGVDWGSAINNINADDIESIDILKGPTASAKYGMRGANGVILISTKKGTKRKGLGLEYTVNFKVIQPNRYRKVQDKYGAGGPLNLLEPSFQTNAAGEFIYPTTVHTSNGPFGRPTTEQFGFYSTGVSWGPEMKGQMLRWWDGELRSFNPQPNNLKQFFKTGTTATHNINFSNGGDFGNFRVSMTYQDHDAVVPNSNFKQYTFNLGSELKLSKSLTSAVSLSYINFNRKNSPSLGDDNNASFGKGILYSWPRSYKGLEQTINFNEDGTRNNYGGNYPFTFTPNHLWWNTYNQNTYLDRNKLIASIGLKWEVNDWLLASVNTGTDFTLNEFERRYNPSDITGINDALYANELDRNRVINSDFLLTAHKDNFKNSNFDLAISFGGTRWNRFQYGINASTTRWENPWLFSFNNFSGADPDNLPLAREIRFDKKINSIYSFLNIDYKDLVFLELSGRNDWSSALPASNNSYFYPSASVSFIFSELLELPEWLSFGKLRGSFAKTASDTDPFLLDFVYQTGTFGGQQTASLPDTKPPSDLRPQQADSYEVGLTLGAFNDRVNLDFSYYYIESFDQILDSPIPNSSGSSQLRINNGILENYGFELGIRAYVKKWKDAFINLGFNLSQNKNYVKSLGDGAEFLELANIWGDFGPKIMVREGEQYGTIYGYDHIYHENGEPIINDAGTHYLVTETIVPIGNASPKFLAGLTTQIKFKNFSLASLVDSRIGGDIYAGSHVIGLQTGQSPQTLNERDGNGLPYVDPSGETRNVGVILPGVLENGVSNDQVVHYYYKYLPNAGGWGKILTTPGIMEHTWIKMRELSLAYSFTDKQTQKLKFLQGLNLSLVGRDLFYLYSSLPDNVNPEGASGSGNAQGLEWASFPNMRSISLRLNAKF